MIPLTREQVKALHTLSTKTDVASIVIESHHAEAGTIVCTLWDATGNAAKIDIDTDGRGTLKPNVVHRRVW